MTKKLLYSLALTAFAFTANAQTKKEATTRGMASSEPMEIGIGVGVVGLQGDLPYKPSFGLSAHVRRSLDAVFSLRAELFYGQLLTDGKDVAYTYGGPAIVNGGGNDTRIIESTKSPLATGEAQLLINLTSLRLDGKKRRLTPYVIVGGGVGYSNTLVNVKGGARNEEFVVGGRLATKIVGTASGGAGVAVKFSEKIFIGLEAKAITLFGKRTDLLDAFDFRWRDIPAYGSVRLNYIMGEGLPAFYASPFDQIQSDIAELKARPKFDPTDTDADGVIDMFDQEKSTPAGYAVDTRGVTLDSDMDGLPNTKDKEPYSPPGYKINADGVAQVPKPVTITEGDVNRIVDAKMADLKAVIKPQAIVDWFLPMINFDFNKSNIKSSEYEKLAYVGNVLQRNPSVRVTVSGYTDAVSSDDYNNNLSYNRSEAAINYLMTKYGVSRDRFVLDYSGEATKLVDTSAKNYINRRVEFRVAQAGESDKGRPSGATMESGSSKKSPKFKGSKEAGY